MTTVLEQVNSEAIASPAPRVSSADATDVPALLVDFDGVLMVTPHTTKPLALSLTWNMGELCNVIR